MSVPIARTRIGSAVTCDGLRGLSVFTKAFSTSSPTARPSGGLFLDFLAPAWHEQPRSSRALSRRTRPASSLVPAPRQRGFATTSPRPATAITNPRKGEDGTEWIINITPRAAHRLSAISEKDQNPDLALRVSVESGGCHGFQYLMSLTSASEADASEDTIFRDEGGEGYKPTVVMDEPSLELLKGSSIDYTMELIGSQFKVTGIPGAKSSCGCGTSFDIAA
ncbi:[4Fe-4S] proteins maturation [Oleoguttula sp. CCFEE 5521]